MDGLYRVRKRNMPGGLANQSHGIRRGGGAMSRSIGMSHFLGTREEGWVRRNSKRKIGHFKDQNGRMDKVEVLFFERILFHSFSVSIRHFNDLLILLG
jgi:hypothetical protein